MEMQFYTNALDFVADGYLDIDIDGTSLAVAIPITILLSILLIFQCAICYIAFSQMLNREKIHFIFKLLFILSFILSITVSIILIVDEVLLMTSYSNHSRVLKALLGSMILLFQYYFYVCLLAVLVFRLHLTFHQSIYKMSQSMFVFLIGILGALCLISLADPIAMVMLIYIPNDKDDPLDLTMKAEDYPSWFMITISVSGPLLVILFLVGSICAVLYFVNNLRLIAKDSAMTASPVSADPVNKIQLRYSNLAARYLLLFGIATSSALLCTVISMAFSSISGMRSIFMVTDCTVNLLCVYFQFGFAEKHYMKCCGCLDTKTRNCISSKINSTSIESSPLKSESSDEVNV